MAGRASSLRRFPVEVRAIARGVNSPWPSARGMIATCGRRFRPGREFGPNITFANVPTQIPPAQYPPVDVRPARCRCTPCLRSPDREIAEHRRTGGARQRVRELLHEFPAVRPGAPCADDGQAVLEHRRLGQRGPVAFGCADFRASPAAARLSNLPVGQDALHRAGAAARLRGTADHRYLSVGLQLDRRLG